MLAVLLAATATATAGATAGAQQSASFELRRFSVTGIADRQSSPSFRNVSTAVLASGSVGVCPTGTVSTLGFWSFTGARDVPIVLRLGKGEADGSIVELFWSGQAAQFELFRGTTATDVTAPENLLNTTTSCEELDTDPGPVDLVFYKVTS